MSIYAIGGGVYLQVSSNTNAGFLFFTTPIYFMEDWHILFASTFLVGLLMYLVLPRFLEPGAVFQFNAIRRSEELTQRIEDSHFRGMITDVQRVELLNRVSTNAINLLMIRRRLNNLLSVENSKRRGDQIIPKEWYDESHSLIISRFDFHLDVVSDIREMVDCANNGNKRASLAMAGRVLDNILNQLRKDHGLCPEADWYNWSIGKKIGAISDAKVYQDPSIGNMWNIINKHRIVGVHAKEAIPIPSDDQVKMVIHAIKDCLSRIINNEKE